MADHDNDERPQFARGTGAPGAATAELRGDCPRRVLDVLDAISMARNMTRTALVNEILGEWTSKVLHEHSLLSRVAGINPTTSDSHRRV